MTALVNLDMHVIVAAIASDPAGIFGRGVSRRGNASSGLADHDIWPRGLHFRARVAPNSVGMDAGIP
jgi:hypothetical protein